MTTRDGLEQAMCDAASGADVAACSSGQHQRNDAHSQRLGGDAADDELLASVKSLVQVVSSPLWFYDSQTGRNICPNRPALELFGVDEDSFIECQLLNGSSSAYAGEQGGAWSSLNARVHQEVEVEGKELGITVTVDKPAPGFLPFTKTMEQLVLTAVYKPFALQLQRTGEPGASRRQVAMVQVLRQHTTAAGACDAASSCDADSCSRLVEMCNNHPMFQFLFDETGNLLAGNKRAMQNLMEHLGDDQRDYKLHKYLSLGEFSAAGESDAKDAMELYREAMKAIFEDAKPCHRFPQLRESKRHPGKYRWVLYEMWPQTDPITRRRAVLICEQNITQVKALEEQFRKQNHRLQAQLEEALSQRDQGHKPAIDIDTPADKTLKLLDKIMRGQEVEAREAMQLRDSIIRSGDLRQPVNFNEQVMGQSQDLEVGESLIQLLSSRRSAKISTSELRPATMDGTFSSLRPIGSAPSPGVMHAPGLAGREATATGVSASSSTAHNGTSAAGSRAGGASGGYQPETGGGTGAGWTLLGGDTSALAAVRWQQAAEDVAAEADTLQLYRNMPDEVSQILSKVDEWQFDAFRLADASGGRPLSTLSYYLFRRFDLIDKFQLDETKLLRFLSRVEEGYPNNPYHNRIHAADVLQSLHVLLCRGNLLANGIVDDTALLACHLSAIIHDFEHRGVNNDYLVRVSDSLAILYNDRSPMENHHLAASFQLMHSDEYNFMPAMTPKVKESLRKLVIEMVLATDMKQHFAIHSMFQAKMQLGAGSGGGGPGSRPVSGSSGSKPEPMPRVLDDDVKTLSIQLALKCADLGHLSSPRDVHRKWVQHLEEEFFRQGDREKRCQLAVSPLMDRDKNGITKSQVGFFDIVALPLFQSFAQVFVETTPMLEAVKDNYTMWREDAALATASFGQRGMGGGPPSGPLQSHAHGHGHGGGAAGSGAHGAEGSQGHGTSPGHEEHGQAGPGPASGHNLGGAPGLSHHGAGAGSESDGSAAVGALGAVPEGEALERGPPPRLGASSQEPPPSGASGQGVSS